jgi:hypothetical protein
VEESGKLAGRLPETSCPQWVGSNVNPFAALGHPLVTTGTTAFRDVTFGWLNRFVASVKN